MQYDEIRIPLQRVLLENKGHFMMAYQICEYMKKNMPEIWALIEESYPPIEGVVYGNGYNDKYSAASFIANTLKYYSGNNGIPGLVQDSISTFGLSVEEIKPNRSQDNVGIWKIVG